MDAAKRKELYYNIVDYMVHETEKLLKSGNLNPVAWAYGGNPLILGLMDQTPADAGAIALVAERAEKALKRTIDMTVRRI